MNELELIIDLHKSSERQGPGSETDTLRALEFMDLPKDKNLKIADIGCGSGGQTITLAKNTTSEITAVDLFTPFLVELDLKALQNGVSGKVTSQKESMDKLPFEKKSIDIIWSEGAIYNMGFEKGIQAWKEFLKPGGYLAVSEVTWISNSRPKEIEDFWKREYPEIDTAANKIKILEENGYTLTGYFYLNKKSWLDNYYQPLEEKIPAFLKKHKHSELAQKVVQDHQSEIELYKKYKDFFSYGFYVARKANIQ